MGKIKFYFTLFLFCGFGWGIIIPCHAQQTVNYTQYIFNYYGLNPAAGGITKCLQARAGQRRQWWGFESAPVTQFFGFYGQLKNKNAYNRSKNVLGVYQEMDKTGVLGPTTRTAISLNYSHHVPLSNNFYLSGGLFAGIIQYTFKRDGVTLNQANDPAIGASKRIIIVPDINPGIMLYNPRFFMGYSMKYAIQNKLNNVFGTASNLSRTHYATIGASILGNTKEYSYLPSINVRMTQGAPIGVDVGFLIDYMDMFRWGIVYRKSDAVCAVLQAKKNRLMIGFGFDYVTSKVRLGAANTFELMINYRFCRDYENGLEEQERCFAYD